MKLKKYSNTKLAFFTLLLPFGYVALFVVLMLIAGLFELFSETLSEIFLFAAIMQLMLYPFAVAAISVQSIVYQIMALRAGESKWKNILMMCISVAYLVLTFVYAARFWERAMGV